MTNASLETQILLLHLYYVHTINEKINMVELLQYKGKTILFVDRIILNKLKIKVDNNYNIMSNNYELIIVL